jgi:membrane associated rhomboid family serine protease
MVLPIRDEYRKLGLFPWVTIILIGVNVLAFLYEILQGSNLEGFFNTFAVVPYEFSTGQDAPPLNPFGFYSTLLTSMFLHGSLAHLLFNMLYLWIFGDNVEDAMGHWRFLVFYLLCGLCGTAAHIYFNPASQIPSLGASGAISGVLGSYLQLFPGHRIQVLALYTVLELPALLVIGFWLLTQVFSGIISLGTLDPHAAGIAYMAHIGGFVAGWLLTPAFAQRKAQVPHRFMRH